jgi:hypothetical protein
MDPRQNETEELVTSWREDIAELNALTETALAKYAPQAADLRYADHVEHVLGQLDELLKRTREIDRLRAARPKPGKPKDHTELVADVDKRLTAWRALLDPPTPWTSVPPPR